MHICFACCRSEGYATNADKNKGHKQLSGSMTKENVHDHVWGRHKLSKKGIEWHASIQSAVKDCRKYEGKSICPQYAG